VRILCDTRGWSVFLCFPWSFAWTVPNTQVFLRVFVFTRFFFPYHPLDRPIRRNPPVSCDFSSPSRFRSVEICVRSPPAPTLPVFAALRVTFFEPCRTKPPPPIRPRCRSPFGFFFSLYPPTFTQIRLLFSDIGQKWHQYFCFCPALCFQRIVRERKSPISASFKVLLGNGNTGPPALFACHFGSNYFFAQLLR